MRNANTTKRDYEEAFQLRRYIWRNYRHALTKRENALHSAATLELKARRSRSDSAAARYRQMPSYFFDSDVAKITDSGLVAFEQQCCDRLLRDHSDEIYINRCERCARIVASPVACACLWCGHHWYARRSEIVARAASSIYPASR